MQSEERRKKKIGLVTYLPPKSALAILPIGSKSRSRISKAKNTAKPAAAMSRRIAIPIIICNAIGSESKPDAFFDEGVFDAIRYLSN